MNKTEIPWGSERGRHFYRTSEIAVEMILERLNLEKLGLNFPTLPLCAEKESVYIEELIPRAKEGFALSLTSEKSSLHQDKDLLEITTPLTTGAIWPKISLSDKQNTLSEYRHVIATLMTLSQSGKISFFQFPDPPSNVDYETGMTQTFWSHSTETFERIWGVMDELEGLTRTALYSTNHMRTQDLLKVGHFFMTGKTISKIFQGS